MNTLYKHTKKSSEEAKDILLPALLAIPILYIVFYNVTNGILFIVMTIFFSIATIVVFIYCTLNFRSNKDFNFTITSERVICQNPIESSKSFDIKISDIQSIHEGSGPNTDSNINWSIQTQDGKTTEISFNYNLDPREFVDIILALNKSIHLVPCK